jgi:hypothetical protein
MLGLSLEAHGLGMQIPYRVYTEVRAVHNSSRPPALPEVADSY